MLSFIPVIWKFIKSPKMLLGIGVAIVLALGVWQWNSMRNTIADQKITISNLTADLAASELTLELSEFNYGVLELRFEREQKSNTDLNVILRGIDNAPDEEDGPISPILRDTLDKLGRLR